MSRRRKHKTTRPSASGRQSTLPISTTPQRLGTVAAAALILIAAGILFVKTHDCGLMGWDSYPLIISSRVQSLGDFVGNFTEKLMDGRYAGDFYRPLVNLSFALDYALWGLKPFGYQLTNVLLFAGCAAALHVLVRRAAGAGATVAPLAALVFFLLHPSQYEVLPVPARRPEMLCCLFMALSLAWQLSARSLGAPRPPIMPAVFTALAIASKETALILPLLTIGAVLLYSPRPTLGKRALHGVTALVPHGIAVAVLVGVRVAILEGMGGHQSTQVSEAFIRFPRYALGLFELLLFPQPAMQAAAAGKWLLAALVAGLILTGVLTLLSRRPDAAQRSSERRLVRTCVIALGWLGLVGLTYAAAGKVQPWYLLLPVAGMALLVGALADALVATLRAQRGAARPVAGATLLLLGALVVWQGRFSPLVCAYDEWERATAASRVFFERLRSEIEQTADGSTLVAPPIPMWAPPHRDRPQIRGAHILTGYSVQAWVELTFPQRRIRVRQAASAPGEQPAADELLVVLTRQMKGF